MFIHEVSHLEAPPPKVPMTIPELSYSCLSRACSEKGGGLPGPSAADSPVFFSSPDVFQLPRKAGATIGCCHKGCLHTYHYPCASDAGKSPSRQVRRCGHSSLDQPLQPLP